MAEKARQRPTTLPALPPASGGNGDASDYRLRALEIQVAQLDARVAQLDARGEQLELQGNRLELQVARMDERINERFKGMNERFKGMNERFSFKGMEKAMATKAWVFGGIVAGTLIGVGFAFALLKLFL